MKRIRRTTEPIKASHGTGYGYLFTADEVTHLLAQMDELRDYPISIDESSTGALQIIVGDSVYQIMDSTPLSH